MQLSLKHYRAAVASALDCIVVMADDGTIAEFNPAAEATFGYKRSEVIGKPLAECIIPKRLRAKHTSALAHYLKTGKGNILGQRVELPAMRKDGSEFPVELTVIPLESDPPAFIGFLRDLSERERMKDELAAIREELITVLRAAPVGITVQDPKGKVLYANETAADMMDVASPEEFLAMPPQAILEMFDLFNENKEPITFSALPGRQAMAGKPSEPVTVCWRRRGTDQERWSIVRAAPLITEAGDLRLIVNTFVDITSQVNAKIQAEVSERRRTAQYEVSRVLLEAESVAAAAQPIVQAIGENLGWQAGALWVLDRESDTISASGVWEAPGFDAEAYRRHTMGTVLTRGEGYPGRVLQSGELMWEETIQDAERFVRLDAAARSGLQGAVFIPLQAPDGCVGVIEMFSRDRLPLDEVWLSVFTMLGAQIGQFIARKWAEELVEALSAPVLPLMRRCLLLPIIGPLDERRVRRLKEKLPAAVHAARARVVVLDVTGAVGLDASGARALADLAALFQLLGCRTVMTGVSTHSSVQLAKLGVDLSRVVTTIDLEGGIAQAARLLERRTGSTAEGTTSAV